MKIDTRQALSLASDALEHAAGLDEPPEPGSQLEADLKAYNAVNDALKHIDLHRAAHGRPRNGDTCGFKWFTDDGIIHRCGEPAGIPHAHACGSVEGCPAGIETVAPGTRVAIDGLRDALDDAGPADDVPNRLQAAVLHVLTVFDARDARPQAGTSPAL
ncbi:MAG: hypothetical protein OXG35_16860 [Acidobacteria bacterium]|nr:hypothetical protein [Acidobacteriota bacterium]